MQDGRRRYQFKHLKLAENFDLNDQELEGWAGDGWEVVSMAIDRRSTGDMTTPEQVNVVYLLRKRT